MGSDQNGSPAEFSARDRQAWRVWLEEHHATEKSVWLVLPKAGSTIPGVGYEEAVEEALRFGWIDSRPRSRDGESHLLLFSRRNPRSRWSRKNRERAERMIREGLMTEAGMRVIEEAKRSGAWTALEEVQENRIPEDLQHALDASPAAKRYFNAFPPSSKRIILEWIQGAKRPETREKRIRETVSMAAENIRANHYRQ